MAELSTRASRPGGLLPDRIGGDRARLVSLPPRAMVNLRGRAEDRHFASSVRDVLGLQLPLTPNRWNGEAETAILWLGPDEWLAMAPPGQAAGIERRLRDAVAGDPWFSAVDLSHNYTGFELSGSAAREVLAKGCPLDLHPRRFGPGQCAQSLLAKTRAVFRAMQGDSIEIQVRNSFARYTASWLLDAIQEFRDLRERKE